MAKGNVWFVVLVLGWLMTVSSVPGEWSGAANDIDCGLDDCGDAAIDDDMPVARAVPGTITFPSTGGSDNSFSVDAPRGSVVTGASFRLTGRSAIPPAQERTATFIDTKNNHAWEGVSKDYPPTGKPNTFQQQAYAADALGSITTEDGNTHATAAYAIGCPYNLFRFKVWEDTLSCLSYRWTGLGFDYIMNWTGVDVYIWNGGRWDSIGTLGQPGISYNTQTYQHSVSAGASGCIDSSGYAYILAMGPYGFFMSALETDYVELRVQGACASWPTDLALDIGADSSVEYRLPGRFNTTVTVGEDVLGAPLQKFIESAGSGPGAIPIIFTFSSRTGGTLGIDSALFEFDTPPVPLPVPPEKLVMDEDNREPLSVPMNQYFRDDRDTTLAYSLRAVNDDGHLGAEMLPDGTLVFRTLTRDWNGVRHYVVTATDSTGLTGAAGINFTVLPVNDPPCISPPTAQIATEDVPFDFQIRASDVDDCAANLTFGDDCPFFEVGPATGEISFSPANEQVGQYTVRMDVRDNKGGSCSVNFSLEILNTNDAPVLERVGDIQISEHSELELTLNANDVDKGDTIVYGVESDIDGLDVDSRTGEIDFLMGEEAVGQHDVTFVATDASGASARETVTLTVINVNDPPAMPRKTILDAVQGETLEYQFTASDPDAGDTLTFSTDFGKGRMSPGGRFKFVPSNGDVGKSRFTVRVTDSGGLFSETDVSLNVANVNDAPCSVRISPPPAGAPLSADREILLIGTATDPDNGDVLTYIWKENGRTLGAGASVSLRLSAGTHIVTLEVSDGCLTSAAELTLAVEAPPARDPGLLARMWPLLAVLSSGLAAVIGGALVFRRRRKGGRAMPRNFATQQMPLPPSPPSPPPAQFPPPPGSTAPPFAIPVAPSPPPHPAAQVQYGPPAPSDASGRFCQPASLAAFSAPAQNPPGSSGEADDCLAIGSQMRMTGPPTMPPSRMSALSRVRAAAGETERRPEPGPVDHSTYNFTEAAPAPFSGNVLPGEDTGVTRDAMRSAIHDARDAMQAARSCGLNTRECDRLLSEAIANSYRLDYPHARNLAKKAEAVALALIARSRAQNMETSESENGHRAPDFSTEPPGMEV